MQDDQREIRRYKIASHAKADLLSPIELNVMGLPFHPARHGPPVPDAPPQRGAGGQGRLDEHEQRRLLHRLGRSPQHLRHRASEVTAAAAATKAPPRSRRRGSEVGTHIPSRPAPPAAHAARIQ